MPSNCNVPVCGYPSDRIDPSCGHTRFPNILKPQVLCAKGSFHQGSPDLNLRGLDQPVEPPLAGAR